MRLLDCPWRLFDLAQRLGRIVRQGNKNPEVEIFRYVTEGTFDSYLYQLVENKQRLAGCKGNIAPTVEINTTLMIRHLIRWKSEAWKMLSVIWLVWWQVDAASFSRTTSIFQPYYLYWIHHLKTKAAHWKRCLLTRHNRTGDGSSEELQKNKRNWLQANSSLFLCS